MRIFGSQRLDSVLQKLGLQKGEAIIHPWINRALEKAQQKVEARNFDIRKHLLKYDDVMNDQRKVIYGQRIEIMQSENLSDLIEEMRHDVIEEIIKRAIPEHTYIEQWDLKGLKEDCKIILGLDLPIEEWASEEGIAESEIKERLTLASNAHMAEKQVLYSGEFFRNMERSILLRLLDQSWKDHLLALDHLRDGINLRAYAQRDPLNEYKQEAFSLFQSMITALRQSVTAALSHVGEGVGHFSKGELPHGIDPRAHESSKEEIERMMAQFGLEDGEGLQSQGPAMLPEVLPAPEKSLRRNDPCSCGSGKKYKACHGKV
ncbi:MAG: hypothetical protein B7Y79_00160 [Rhodospirillales bacterium 35-44-4]|nr:MAG: hypothetical protein B7Y79_00160 [Rhodospirillales bacterium 35-44-4]